MSDHDCVKELLQFADADKLQAAQHTAARKLLAYDGEVYPADGCAITLSVELQEAGIKVSDKFTAIGLGDALKELGWKLIKVGKQCAGDVGSTCGDTPNHGSDHVYLVLKVINDDEMVIADNQSHQPHFRFASGKGGKTPTRFFLRAPE